MADDLSRRELQRLTQGDELAFTALVKTWHGRLRGFARSLVGDVWADEVLQDAWMSIHGGLPDFAGRSKLSTWLYTVVRNAALSRIRKEKRMVSLDAMMAEAHTPDPEAMPGLHFNESGGWQRDPGSWDHSGAAAQLEQEELQRCLNQVISSLPQMQQTVLHLRDIEQLALSDICNILELGASNVRVLLHRARLSVRAALQIYMETGECSSAGK